MKVFIKVFLTGMVAFFFTACGGGGGTDTPPVVSEPVTIEELVSFDIEFQGDDYIYTHSGLLVGKGIEIQLIVSDGNYKTSTTDSSGTLVSFSYRPVDCPVTWETSDPTVATVDSNGLLKAISVGDVLIEATCDGVVAEMNLEIVPAYVKELILTPSEETITINVGDILKFSTEGLMTDGTIVPIGAGWDTSNPTIAMVWGYVIDGTNRVGGWVEGFEAGTVTIKASYPQRADGYTLPTAYGEVTVIVE